MFKEGSSSRSHKSRVKDTAAPYRRNAAAELRDWPAEEISRVRVVLRRLTALRIENPEDAEDLVQETLLTMTEKCPAVVLRKGLLVWAMGILRKKVGNYYRRTQRYTALDREILNAQTGSLFPAQAPADSSLHQVELSALVATIVERLPPQQQIVMELLLEGLTTSEIANLLYPERYQNIVNRVHRGRKKLYKELAKHGYMFKSRRKEKRGRKPVPGS